MKRKKNKKACHFTTPYHPYINSRIQTVAVEIVGLEDNSYHLIVPVEINGIQGDMIIDTGASVTVVDRQVFPEDLPEEGIDELDAQVRVASPVRSTTYI